MAFNYYLGVSGDWTSALNWSSGAAPASGEDIVIDKGDSTITLATNMVAAGSGVNFNSIRIGPNFRGKLGSSSNKWNIGTITDKIVVDAQQAIEVWLSLDTTDSVPLLVVESTNPLAGELGLVLFGQASSGTWANVYVKNDARITVENLTAVTNLRNMGTAARTYLKSGSAVTTARQYGGQVDCEAAVTTIECHGGQWNHTGTTTFNVTTLNIGGGSFYFGSNGGTITSCFLDRGSLQLNAPQITTSRTITNLYHAGGTLLGRNLIGHGVTVTNPYYSVDAQG